MRARAGLLGWAALAPLLAGCPAVTTDPPPPPTKAEIAPAPPHARGALAAGTDAAPVPEANPGNPAGALPQFPPPAPGGALGAPSAGSPPAEPEVSPAEPSDAGVPL